MASKKRKIRVLLYFAAMVAVALFNQFGERQSYFEWTLLYTHILQSVQALLFTFALLETINLFIRSSRVRHIIRNLFFAITAIVIFSIFQDRLVAIGISLGILVGVLTIVLQSAIVSVAGWAYLRTTSVYGEGDRIKIGDIKGDVLDITLGNTKILEVGGDYVANDLPSGRLITVPNSSALTEKIINYSRIFPYIWVDIPFHLTYETDFPFVIRKVDEILSNYMKRKKKDMKEDFEKFMNKFDVEQREVKFVQYNYEAMGGFMEFRITFPVRPENQSQIVTEVTQELLEMFNKHPEKVRFPIGRNR